MNLAELPPANNWGHWHANMVELWVNVYGNVCALISGVGVVRGELGDVINANEERWHRATSCPNTGKSIRMAMTLAEQGRPGPIPGRSAAVGNRAVCAATR
jgi:hypothetical protein